jgi:phosphatidylglycerophosphate synthase
MLDPWARAVLAGPLGQAARYLDRPAVTPNRLTVAGLVLGLGSAGAAAGRWWTIALLLWLASRLADGLDGPLARRRGATNAGGYLDICADFCVYGASAVGVGIGAPGGGLPFLFVMLAYYVNGTAFLAFSSIAERAGQADHADRRSGGRSLNFLGGIAEGTETIVVHTLWLLLPGMAGPIAWIWAGLVGLTAGHRVVDGYCRLRTGPAATTTASVPVDRRDPHA